MGTQKRPPPTLVLAACGGLGGAIASYFSGNPPLHVLAVGVGATILSYFLLRKLNNRGVR